MRGVVGGVGLVLLLALPAGIAGAASVSDETAAFVAELQQAVRADDKSWLGGHLHLPVSYFGKKTLHIKNKAWFIKHYATLMSPELKANVLATKPDEAFENWQGVMIGDGGRNIWVRDFGTDAEPRYEIVTINNSD
jgi:hypothetical protein